MKRTENSLDAKQVLSIIKKKIDPENLKRKISKQQTANEITTHSWGQTVVRFYDPDRNLIEVGMPV